MKATSSRYDIGPLRPQRDATLRAPLAALPAGRGRQRRRRPQQRPAEDGVGAGCRARVGHGRPLSGPAGDPARPGPGLALAPPSRSAPRRHLRAQGSAFTLDKSL